MRPKPTLRDFGLTERVVADLLRPREPGFWSRLATRLERPLDVLGYSLALAWFAGGLTGRIPGPVFFLAPVSLLVAFMLGVVLWGLLSRLRSDPTREAYDRYAAAVNDWDTAVANERHRQEQEARRRRRDWWRSLPARAFEHAVAETFGRCGHDVSVLGGRGDGGVDVLVDSHVIVQCKAHKQRVGPAVVRELCGALQTFGARSAVLVAREGCSEDALALATRHGIRVLNIDDLIDLETNHRPIV